MLKIISPLWQIYFIVPIFVLYLLGKGISLAQVLFLQAVFAALIIILEVPTGYLSDKFRRKDIFISGLVAQLFGVIIYIIGQNFIEFLIAEIAFATSRALLSGTDSAMMYEYVGKAFKKEWGDLKSWLYFYGFFANILGGFLGGISLVLPFYILLGTTCLAIILSFALKEPERKEKATSIKGNVMNIVSNKDLIVGIVFFAALSGLLNVFVWPAQPFAKELGVPLTIFGFFLGLINLISGVIVKYIDKLEKLLGEWILILSIPTVEALFFAIWGFFHTQLAFYAILLVPLVRGLATVLKDDYIHKRVSSKERATAISVSSMTKAIVYSIWLIIFGYVAEITNLQGGFLMTAATVAIIGIAYMFYNYFRPRALHGR